jgi:hypothetical protein
VIWFSPQALSVTFLILRRTERDMTNNVYRSSGKVSVILVWFEQNFDFLARRKNSEIWNFIKIRIVWDEFFLTYGRTDKNWKIQLPWVTNPCMGTVTKLDKLLTSCYSNTNGLVFTPSLNMLEKWNIFRGFNLNIPLWDRYLHSS